MVDYSPNNRLGPIYLNCYKSINWIIIDHIDSTRSWGIKIILSRGHDLDPKIEIRESIYIDHINRFGTVVFGATRETHPKSQLSISILI